MMAEKTGETVTVACKLPHGLVLRIFEKRNVPVQGPNGEVRVEPMSRPIQGKSHQIRGYAEKYDPAFPPPMKTSSFAFTDGVPKDFWDAWLKQNTDLDMIENNLLFAMPTPEAARRRAAELEGETRSGFEPIVPSKDLPKAMQAA